MALTGPQMLKETERIAVKGEARDNDRRPFELPSGCNTPHFKSHELVGNKGAQFRKRLGEQKQQFALTDREMVRLLWRACKPHPKIQHQLRETLGCGWIDQPIDKLCNMGSDWVLGCMERVAVSEREQIIAALQKPENIIVNGREVAEEDTVTRGSGTVSAEIIENVVTSGEATEGLVVTEELQSCHGAEVRGDQSHPREALPALNVSTLLPTDLNTVVAEKDAKNDEVSEKSDYGVGPAEEEPQSCHGGEAEVCGDQPHHVEAMPAQNVSTQLAVVRQGKEEPVVSPVNEEPEVGPAYEEPEVGPAYEEPEVSPAYKRPKVGPANREPEKVSRASSLEECDASSVEEYDASSVEEHDTRFVKEPEKVSEEELIPMMGLPKN